MGTVAYDKQNTKQIKFKLNNKYDADILEHLKKQENMQGYIKALIRADIAANAANAANATHENHFENQPNA